MPEVGRSGGTTSGRLRMVIAQVAYWRPRPGRFEDFVKACNQARKIQQRLGGQVRIFQGRWAAMRARWRMWSSTPTGPPSGSSLTS